MLRLGAILRGGPTEKASWGPFRPWCPLRSAESGSCSMIFAASRRPAWGRLASFCAVPPRWRRHVRHVRNTAPAARAVR
jgi:hypothetical protein